MDHLGTEESAVRVELLDIDSLDVQAPDHPPDERAGPPSLLLLAAAAVFVGLIIVALRPEEGRNAAGEPLTEPTTTTTGTTGSTTSTDPPSATTTDPSAEEQISEFDGRSGRGSLAGASAEFRPYLVSVVETSEGWLGIGIDNNPALWESADGLTWLRTGNEAPSGTPVGLLDTGDDVLLIVDEEDTWSRTIARDFDTGSAAYSSTHRLTFWVSSDGSRWEASPEFEPMEDAGLPIHANNYEDSVVVSSFVEQVPDLGPGLEFLSAYVDPTLLDDVCRVETTFDEIALFDCGDETILRLDETDFADTAEWSRATACTRRHFEFAGPSIALTHVAPSLNPVRTLALAGTPFEFVATDDGWISVESDRFGAGIPAYCDDPIEGDDGPSLIEWSRGEGQRDLAMIETDEAVPFFGSLVRSPDDSILYMSAEGVFRAAEPYVDWSLALPTPVADFENSFGFTPLSASLDGRAVLSQSRGAIWIARIESDGTSRWFEVPTSGQAALYQLVLTTDSSVIVRDEADFPPRLVRVPLDGDSPVRDSSARVDPDRGGFGGWAAE